MNDTLEILQASRSLKLRGETITVRELSWMELKNLLAALAGQAEKFLDKESNLKFDAEKVIALVRDSQELSERVVRAATGLDQAWIDQLTCGEFMAVLDQALELNLLVLSDSAKKIGGRLRSVFGSQAAVPMTPTSPRPSTF